jgi:hypothetical protein
MTDRNDVGAESAGWDFGVYLRTGRLVRTRRPVEIKFNPNHDPENGRFTFASGGAAATRGAHQTAPGRAAATPVSRSPASPPRPVPPVPPERHARTGRDIGRLSAGEESRGPGTISTGRGDAGGVSYGDFQIQSADGNIDRFVASTEFTRWAPEFRGLTPNTEAFYARWRAVAAREPDAFEEAQHAYVERTRYHPTATQVRRATGYDLDTASNAV